MRRCDYCNRQANTVLKWQSWISKMGCRRAITVQARACQEHEACVNFLAMRRIHPDARVETTEAVRR